MPPILLWIVFLAMCIGILPDTPKPPKPETKDAE